MGKKKRGKQPELPPPSNIVRLLGLQDAAERLIALGSRIPESLFPDWFAESRKMLTIIRADEAKLLEEIEEDELLQFVFLSYGRFTRDNKLQAKKIISVPLEGKTKD